MCRSFLSLCSLVVLVLGSIPMVSLAADDPVFSGPQPGEKLPPLRIKMVGGEQDGKVVDLVAESSGQPMLIMFMHERTRPAFGLIRTVMSFAETRMKDGLKPVYVFLSDDPTETESWLRRLNPSLFSRQVPRGISPEGIEGPGAYGLNRNVTVTALVSKDGKVTANFALVQPSEQADGPKILKAVVTALGGGPVPNIAQFSRNQMTRRPRMDRELATLVRQVMNPETDEATAREAIAKVDQMLKQKPASRASLAAMAKRIVDSDRLESLPKPSQTALRSWSKAPAPRAEVNLRPLIAPLINKSATPEQVDAAAKKVEERIGKDADARATLARITRTIVDSGKLQNYGTEEAQAYLKKWAKELNAQRRE